MTKNGKVIKPVKRRKESQTIDPAIHCSCCQAPSDYLYLNNGRTQDNQYQCKICHNLFNHKNRFLKEVRLKCPHCEDTLVKIKQRKGFSIHKCRSLSCPFYQKRLKGMSKKERKASQKNKNRFKMHYIYREFELTLSELEDTPDYKTVVQLNNINCSPRVLGLILTYHVNYGMSGEETAALMYDIHQVKISGRLITISNAKKIKKLIDSELLNNPVLPTV